MSGRETIVSDCALCVECRLVRINAIPLVNLIKTLDSSQLLFAACLSLKHHRREPLLVQTITNRECALDYLPPIVTLFLPWPISMPSSQCLSTPTTKGQTEQHTQYTHKHLTAMPTATPASTSTLRRRRRICKFSHSVIIYRVDR